MYSALVLAFKKIVILTLSQSSYTLPERIAHGCLTLSHCFLDISFCPHSHSYFTMAFSFRQ